MNEIDVSGGFDLGCYHFEVATDAATDAELRSRQRYGECSCTRIIVSISTDFSPDQYHNTFLHELAEAVNENNCNGKVNHDAITNLANGFSQAFKSMGIRFTHPKMKTRGK